MLVLPLGEKNDRQKKARKTRALNVVGVVYLRMRNIDSLQASFALFNFI